MEEKKKKKKKDNENNTEMLQPAALLDEQIFEQWLHMIN